MHCGASPLPSVETESAAERPVTPFGEKKEPEQRQGREARYTSYHIACGRRLVRNMLHRKRLGLAAAARRAAFARSDSRPLSPYTSTLIKASYKFSAQPRSWGAWTGAGLRDQPLRHHGVDLAGLVALFAKFFFFGTIQFFGRFFSYFKSFFVIFFVLL